MAGRTPRLEDGKVEAALRMRKEHILRQIDGTAEALSGSPAFDTHCDQHEDGEKIV